MHDRTYVSERVCNMCNWKCKMKRLLSIAGSLLGLLAFGVLIVALALTFGGLHRGPEPGSWMSQSPIETPTQPPYPLPETPTRPLIPTIPPTVTRPPKPSPIPSPTPTATPIPTPLPLPPSSFYALWAENFPEGQGSVLWLADPRDIGSRREVLRFDRDAIIEATLSPNGRKLALVTTYWKTSTLWVANADGTDLRQFDQSLSPPLEIRGLSWSRDSRMLAYVGFVDGEQTIIDKAGTPVVEPALLDTIELLDVTTGQKQHLVEVNPNEALFVIGWSTNGRELYYVRREIGYGYGLWVIDRISREAHKIISLDNEPILPFLSPDGSKLLIATYKGLSWVSTDGREKVNIPITRPERGYQAIWSPNSSEIIIGQADEQRPVEYVKAINVHTLAVREIGTFEGRRWRFLSISPDYHWLASYQYYTGLHWIYLPTGMMVPVPCPPDGYCIFVAWVPRMKAGQ